MEKPGRAGGNDISLLSPDHHAWFFVCKRGSACPPTGWRKDWCSAWHLASVLGTWSEGKDAQTETASPQEGPAGARVCGALGPAAQRGPYLNSGHHSSGDPRLATHPGSFSCRIKGAVRYT